MSRTVSRNAPTRRTMGTAPYRSAASARKWKGSERLGHSRKSVPASIRAQAQRTGLQRGLFDETEGWPHQLYVREARRLVSDYVLTQHDLAGARQPEDSIGLGSYGVDDWPYATVALEAKTGHDAGRNRHRRKAQVRPVDRSTHHHGLNVRKDGFHRKRITDRLCRRRDNDINSHNSPRQIDQRTATVARVDGRIGLNQVVEGFTIWGQDRSVERADECRVRRARQRRDRS